MWRVLLGVALAVAALARAAEEQPKRPGDASPDVPVGFCITPEMMYIPEVADWPRCEPDAVREQTQGALADWKGKRPWVEKRLTPELARSLSRWARKEMEAYRRVPPLAKVDFQPVRHHKASRKLVLKGVVDTLPSHSPIVTRWLLVYLLYDEPTRSVVRMTVTIRGQILE